MYAETGLMMFPYSHNFPQFQQFEEVYFPEKLNAPSDQELPGGFVQTSVMPDYYPEEGDLFNASEPMPEEPFMDLFEGDAISPQTSLAIPETEPFFESGQLMTDVFYECKKDLQTKAVGFDNAMPLSEAASFEIPLEADEVSDAPIQKSVSMSCLKLLDLGPETSSMPNCIDVSLLDFGTSNGIRRAYSEGDIKNLGDVSITQQATNALPKTWLNCIFNWEDRKEKLSRYRNKKSKRNFGRKIK